MTGIYLTWLADVLRANGLTVVDSGYGIDGWQRRARSSGGFPSSPLGVQWHHTASNTQPANDVRWQLTGEGNPIGNMTIMRDGSVWLICAGAANTAGKGGPLTLSKGTVPLDSANTRTVAIEVANNGVGQAWPQVQIDAFFTASNAINRQLGNLPTDVFSHAVGTGNGWTNRKIDPATAAAVQGPWKPRSVNNSGTWSLDDIRSECNRRWGSAPIPIPPTGDDEMASVIKGDATDTYWAWNGVSISGIPSLEWVNWGVESGHYSNSDPIVYPQGFIDQLVQTQGQ
jgi:hypothetical protein